MVLQGVIFSCSFSNGLTTNAYHVSRGRRSIAQSSRGRRSILPRAALEPLNLAEAWHKIAARQDVHSAHLHDATVCGNHCLQPASSLPPSSSLLLGPLNLPVEPLNLAEAWHMISARQDVRPQCTHMHRFLCHVIARNLPAEPLNLHAELLNFLSSCSTRLPRPASSLPPACLQPAPPASSLPPACLQPAWGTVRRMCWPTIMLVGAAGGAAQISITLQISIALQDFHYSAGFCYI